MRIAFETSTISTRNPTGIGRYATTLIEELVRQAGDVHQFSLLNKLSRLKNRHMLYRHPGIPAKFYLPVLSSLKNKFDILHALDAFMPFWPGTSGITTVHDLFVLRSSDDSFAPRAFRRRREQNYKKIARRSDAIIAVSQNTKNDVIDLLGIPADKIFVTHLGIDSAFSRRQPQEIRHVKSKYGIDGDYLLYVGTINARKNIGRLIGAYHRSGLHRDLKLVLAGPLTYGHETILADIGKLGLESRITVAGFVGDGDLPALYSGANGFAFPTLYEGFGIPPLEAMACGTPVLTGNAGSSPELCAGHAVLVDPLDEAAIADGLLRLLAMPAPALARAAAHARTFTWSRCAKQTLEVYRQLGD